MGMNCAALTDFTFSFRGFARRGGDTDVHSHGWGKKNDDLSLILFSAREDFAA